MEPSKQFLAWPFFCRFSYSHRQAFYVGYFFFFFLQGVNGTRDEKYKQSIFIQKQVVATACK